MNPRIQALQDTYSQDWEVYMVLSDDHPLATYVELDTVCNTEDLYNMLEIIEAKAEYAAIAKLTAEQNKPS